MTSTVKHGSRPTGAGDVVIIGSGLTGVVISRALSRAKVPHLLIGGPPGTLPRLGESMNLEGSLAMTEWFPEASRHVFPKRAGVGYFGEHELTCEFNLTRSRVSRALFRLLGHQAPSEFLHVDRLGFDELAYRESVSSPYCTEVRDRVTAIDYRPDQDAIGAIALDSGMDLSPAYVFDATNRGRVVAQAAGVPCYTLGRAQRVVYTHYHMPSGSDNLPEEDWEHATNILGLFKPVDGVNGLAWVIPLGRYVSVGISTNVGETDEPGSELLEHTARAYERRGLSYRRRFHLPKEIVELEASFFVHDRAYGRNWLLAGPAFCQVWWMASAGVASAFSAATIAARFIRDPARTGHIYERYMVRLLRVHSAWDWFAVTNPRAMTRAGVGLHSDRFISSNVERLVASTKLSSVRFHRVIGAVIQAGMIRSPVVHQFCRVSPGAVRLSGEVARARETRVDEERAVTVVGHLMEVLAGQRALASSRSYLDDDVILHVDRFTFRGAELWMRWVAFLRARAHPGGLAIRLQRMIVNPDRTITVWGQWCTKKGKPRFSAPLSARYKVAGTTVTEVWSSRTNYEFMFGPKCRSQLAWIVIMARMCLWDRWTKVRGTALREVTEPRAGEAPPLILSSEKDQIGGLARANLRPDRP